MRIIYITVTCLGLFLLVLSREEIAQVQRYCALVTQVKTTVIRFYSDERLTHRTYMTSPSMESVLSDLDAAVHLQRGWRSASWIGVAVSIVGIAGLAFSEWRRRHPVQKHTEQEPLRVKLAL